MQSPEQSERSHDETSQDDNPIDGKSYVAHTDSEDIDDMDAEDDSDDSDLNLLIAMAELDAEAAEAYRIAAEYTDQVHLRSKLEEFRADHLRHVETFNRLLTEAGVLEVSTDLDEESSAVTMLAASMGTMGVKAALLAMIANERLTNTAYEAAVELPFEEDVARILEMHLLDEQRHLQWLSEQESRVHEDDLDVEADA